MTRPPSTSALPAIGMAASKPHVAVIVGTRPEAVKLAPVVRALGHWVEARVILSGQHVDLIDGVLADVGLTPDIRLEVMRAGQSLNGLTHRLVEALSTELVRNRPDAVVVQGDTTTAMCAALVAFHENVPVAHVEAGLRSHDPRAPFPEEINRRLISQMSTWHFAPTRISAENLLREGFTCDSVMTTGNTVVDALRWILEQNSGVSAFEGMPERRMLVTLHRRETQGAAMAEICRALSKVAERLQLEVVLPMHPSPAVRDCIRPALIRSDNVRLLEPMRYPNFIATLAEAALVVTDSGGVQEEAASLGVPVLITRDTTERPEVVDSGCARLVGTSPTLLAEAVVELMTDVSTQAAMTCAKNPFGDGHASERIARRLLHDLAPGNLDLGPGPDEEMQSCVSI